MGLSIMGIARTGRLMGPSMSYSFNQTLKARIAIATALHTLLDSEADPFLMAVPGRFETADEMVEPYFHYLDLLLELDEPRELGSAHGRMSTIADLERRYLDETLRIEYYPERSENRTIPPLLAALDAFVNCSDSDGLWSIGQTADIAMLFEAVCGSFRRRGGRFAEVVLDDFAEFEAAFSAFRAAGAYAVRC